MTKMYDHLQPLAWMHDFSIGVNRPSSVPGHEWKTRSNGTRFNAQIVLLEMRLWFSIWMGVRMILVENDVVIKLRMVVHGVGR